MNRLLVATSIAFVLSSSLFAKEKVEEPTQTRFESLSKLTKIIGNVGGFVGGDSLAIKEYFART